VTGRRTTVLGLAVALVVGGATYVGVTGSTADARPVAGTGCPTFPADNWWHADVRHLPVNKHSRAWLSHMHTGLDLHPDFGPSYGDGPDYGIPITVVGGTHAKVRVHFRYSSESDHVRYPLGADTRIEGGRRSDGDRHAIVVDRSTCRLYETYATRKRDGRWHAGSGAVWSLTSNALRPDGWTSADAAGLPIFPGLARWDEAKRGVIDHALRFTVQRSRRAYLYPARHYASSLTDANLPPMGLRVRLKASFDIRPFPRQARIVLTALKRYGMLVADNGSNWYISGAPSPGWSNDQLHTLGKVTGSNFEVVDTSSIKP